MSFGIDDAIAAGLQVLNKFVPDPEARAKAETDLRNSLQSWDKAQTDVNAVEAANPNLFVSGWRPFIGWVCGLGCGWNWIGIPVVTATATILGYPVVLGMANLSEMFPLLLGMLGIGGLRTVEKLNGVHAK